jgi:hypothetical protein
LGKDGWLRGIWQLDLDLIFEKELVKREPEAGSDWIRAGKLVIFCKRLLFGSGTEHARLDGGFIERRDLARETLNRTYNFLLYSLSIPSLVG